MEKRYTYLIIIIFFLLIVVIHFVSNANKLHTPINENDVKYITIYGHNTRVVSAYEKKEIIKWFNSITGIRNNKEFAGTTPEAGIIIDLKAGNRILILQSGIDFEVQRTNIAGNPISYWGKQPNIRNLLDEASK